MTANRFSEERADNLYFEKKDDGISFIVGNEEGCKLSFYTHFRNWSVPCKMDYTPINLSISTDKYSYLDNETIFIEVEPSDEEVELEYGNNTFYGYGSFQVRAYYPYNRIKVTLNGISAEKVIPVKRKDGMGLMMELSVFSFLNYFLYVVFRKYLNFM